VAIALSIRYSEFLFKKAHRAYVHKYDWALTWALTVLSLAGVTLGLWWFRRVALAFAWLIYGALMLTIPYLIAWLSGRYEPDFACEWDGWRGLAPSFVAGVAGAVMSCVWFGWYLAVCFTFNGHNNEVGSASRIEEFKQFIRFRLTEEGLTGYVIGVDRPQEDKRRQDLNPEIIDVFHLRVKPD